MKEIISRMFGFDKQIEKLIENNEKLIEQLNEQEAKIDFFKTELKMANEQRDLAIESRDRMDETYANIIKSKNLYIEKLEKKIQQLRGSAGSYKASFNRVKRELEELKNAKG